MVVVALDLGVQRQSSHIDYTYEGVYSPEDPRDLAVLLSLHILSELTDGERSQMNLHSFTFLNIGPVRHELLSSMLISDKPVLHLLLNLALRILLP